MKISELQAKGLDLVSLSFISDLVRNTPENTPEMAPKTAENCPEINKTAPEAKAGRKTG